MATKDTILGLDQQQKKTTTPVGQNSSTGTTTVNNDGAGSKSAGMAPAEEPKQPVQPVSNGTQLESKPELVNNTVSARAYWQDQANKQNANDVQTNQSEQKVNSVDLGQPIAKTDEMKALDQQNAASKQTTETKPEEKVEEPKKLTYTDMFEQLNAGKKPMTDEERKAQEKKEKREKLFSAIGDGLSSLSNLYFSTKGAPSMYDPTQSMSKKTQDRWDKINKEREENDKYYNEAYLRARQLDDANEKDERNWKNTLEQQTKAEKRDERNFEWQKQQAEQQQANWQKTFEASRSDRAEDVAFRDKQFAEGVRQFGISSAQAASRINMESQRLQRELAKDNVTFGTGAGTISVPSNNLNAVNISRVFSKLPADVRNAVHGDPVYTVNDLGEKVQSTDANGLPVYNEPTTEAMLIAIGMNIDGNPDAQQALKDIGGSTEKTNKGTGYSNNNGKGKGY